MASLAEALARHTRQGVLYTMEAEGRVRCVACGHRCSIPEGGQGVCKVRFNHGGRLMVPWGYVSGAQCDPIEKKPFFHAYPGSKAFSFGMLGCNLHCSFCQNWVTSQALRDPHASLDARPVSASALVDEAQRRGARAVVSTYNEPLVTTEWAVEVFTLARHARLATAFVSNGHATPETLEYLAPWIDLFKVDLKGFDDRRYRQLGGRLEPVLDTIRALHALGIWIEVVTLLVPGFNDDPAEVAQLTEFIAGVSPDIPWHVTAYHEDYQMGGNGATSPAMLLRAAARGRESGLRYVYAGNLPGMVGGLEDTACGHCGALLVQRAGYHIAANRIGPDGLCPDCGACVPGRWGEVPATRTVG